MILVYTMSCRRLLKRRFAERLPTIHPERATRPPVQRAMSASGCLHQLSA